MGEYNLEQHIKQSLENHPTPLDKALLWKGIQEKQKESSFKKFGLFSLGIICIASLCLFIYFQESSNHLSNKNLHSENNTSTIETSSTLQIVNTQTNISQNSITKDSKLQNHNKNNSESINTKSSKKETESITLTQNIENQSKVFSNSISNIPADQSSNLDTKKHLSKESKFNTQMNLSRTGTQKSTANLDTKKHSFDNFNKIQKNSSTLESTSSNLETNIFSSAKTKSVLNSDNISKATSIQLLTEFEALQSNQVSNMLTLEREIKKDLPAKEECFRFNKKSIECYDPSKKRNAFFVSAYALADYTLKSTSTILENQNYLAERDSTTHYQLSNRAGIHLKYLFTNGFYLKSGIEQGILRENFYRKTTTTTTEILPNQLINIDVDMNGDSTKTYGNAPVTTIKTTTWDVNNTHKSLDIPFLVGYQTKKGPIKYALEAGVLMNLSYAHNGWLIGPNGQPTNSTSSSGNSYYSDKAGLNITGGLNVLYAMTPKLNALLIASFRSNMDTVNSNINPIKEKNIHLGLGIGIEYKLK